MTAGSVNASRFVPCTGQRHAQNPALPVQFQGKLELARIVGGGGLAGLVHGRVDGGDVIHVGDVEDVGAEIHVEALSEVEALGQAHVVENGPRGKARITAEAAVKRGQRAIEAEDARLLQEAGGRELGRHGRVAAAIRRRSRGHSVRASGEGRQLEVVAIAGDDVERAAGTELDHGSERPIAEELASDAAAAQLARLIDAAEDEAMALIEGGRGTIGGRDIAVLRGERGLEVGGIVDGVRPSVGGEEFVVAAEALAEIGGQPVIDRTAVGVVGIHIAERNAAGVGKAVAWVGIAVGVEAGQSGEKSLGLRHTSALAAELEGGGNGRVQSAGAEEVHERRIDVARTASAHGKGTAGGGTVRQGGKEIGGHQVAANRVSVDGTVDVAAAVEVVGHAQGVATAEIVLDGEVRLLRVSVNEVLGLRITEGLEGKRQESRRARVQVKVVLVEEDRLREVERLKLLLVRQIIKSGQHQGIVGGRAGRGDRSRGRGQQSLEYWDCVQVANVSGAAARSRAAEGQLAAARAVGSIAEEIEAEQGVVVEHAKRSADDGLAVSLGIPRDAQARLNVVGVGLDAFLQSQGVIGGKSQPLRGLESGREFHVVADAVVEREIVAHTPKILPEHAQGFVGERVGWAAETLNKSSRDAEAVGLRSREAGNAELGGEGRLQCTVDRAGEGIGGREWTEVVHAAVVHREGGLEREKVEVATEFCIVPPYGPGEIVGELVALFGAPDVGVGLATEIGEAENVDGRVGAARDLGVVEIRQATAGELEAEFIHPVVAESPRVLGYASHIAVGLFRSA